MTIQYCSDLHLEFEQNRKYLKLQPIIPKSEILILAGDIVPIKDIEKHNDFFNYLSDHFDQTYWVPGNHEYYHGDILARKYSFNEAIKSNVFFLNNETIRHGEVTLIFSTLWSAIGSSGDWEIQRNMADYRLIKFGNRRFTTYHSSRLHRESYNYIQEQVMLAKGKIFVTSHHVPTFHNYPIEYKKSPLNEAFATELADFIASSEISYWLYGHHHRNIPSFQIGKTSLITNQLGYIQRNEHLKFRNDAIVTL